MNDTDWLNEQAELAPETTVRERPILFSGPMVRALLDGRKTQTRRVVKPQPRQTPYGFAFPSPGISVIGQGRRMLLGNTESQRWVNGCCPYGQPGDTLYVKEAWQAWHRCSVEYDEWEPITRSGLNDRGLTTVTEARDQGYVDSIEYRATSKSVGPWRSGRFMPRSASRLTLKLTDVRVERLQAISEEDAIKEGSQTPVSYLAAIARQACWTERQAFAQIWDALNGKRPGCSWTDSPWVWVLSFERITGEAGV